ncbi:MAG TPA: T9SS type A sorting domain-containing protein, partial [Ohtaekwangia sp.]|uniref:T9SS type A sorting domain-containing protein n=1 Tax=Ohtaekwangia sp. TaxID=2066019 RepID=UPI002F95BAAD
TYGACNTTVSYTVNEPTQVAVSFNTPLYNGYAIKCNGGSTGETTAIGSGGKGGYKDFSWNTGAITDKITGVAAGTYTVTLKDTNGCSATNQVILQEPAALQVSLSKATDYNSYAVSCWDKSDGGIMSTISGGVTSYSYLWSTGATTSSVSGLGVNTYSLTVTDANSCTASSSLALTAPAKIDFTINQLATLNCPGDKTAILEGKPVAATIIGAAHYTWSSGETTATITDKGSGIYSLTVSDDQTCSTTKSITLAEPAANTVSIVPQSNFNGSFIKCNGDSNGILATVVKDANNNTITAQDYLWTENGNTIGESATLTSVNNVSEGLYKVVITYNTQCKAEATYFLSDPDAVTVAVSAATNYNGQPISCYNMTDARLHAVASGGTGALSYTWNTGGTGSLLSNVGAGNYTVTASDVNGCVGTGSLSLDNPEPVQAVIASVSDYAGFGTSCSGVSDGAITATGTGGTGIYTYSWSNGKTTAKISGLAAGSYTVSVSDNNGCRQSIEQSITSPSALALSVTDLKNISCFGGSDGTIELNASGGVSNYMYSDNNRASWQSQSIFQSLAQGSYTIILKDGNGCEKNLTTSLTQPDKIDITFNNIQPAFCSQATGAATAVVTGGVSGYKYSWQDSKGNILGTDGTLSNVKGGIYTVYVTDNNACQVNNNVGITSTDGAKSDYTAMAAKCFDSSDGSATITITQGDGPFGIAWPDGQTSLQGINLKKGTYDVQITDAHTCTVVQTVVVPAPDALALAIGSQTLPTCNGSCDGAISLQASGGVGNYIYRWNNASNATQNQLCAAVYPVIVSDANGCSLQQEIELKQPEPILVSAINLTLPTCKDGCDGALEVAATGGNGGYNYTWAIGGNTTVKNNLCPGTYAVSVTDMKGCKGESMVTLANTPALPLDLGGGVTLCIGQSYTLDADTGWVNMKWGSSTGFTSIDQKVTVKDAGRYWIEVINDKGCIAQDTFQLETSYNLLQASFMIPKQAAIGDTVVMIDISWPLPEKIEWTYPLAMTKLQDHGDVLYGQFKDAGTYEVSLAAHLGECFDQVSKTITIIESEDGTVGGRLGYEEYVKRFILYPNPNSGSFDVGIELSEALPVSVSVWHSPSGVLIKQVQQEGDAVYQLYFDLRPLSPGIYLVKLDYGKGERYIRFVVN